MKTTNKRGAKPAPYLKKLNTMLARAVKIADMEACDEIPDPTGDALDLVREASEGLKTYLRSGATGDVLAALSEAWEIGAGHNKPTFEQLNRWHAALAKAKGATS